jgi:hypothetical protein
MIERRHRATLGRMFSAADSMVRAITKIVTGEPTLGRAFVLYVAVAIVVFTRNPFTTNFIFDEQEALLANPYVRAVTEWNSGTCLLSRPDVSPTLAALGRSWRVALGDGAPGTICWLDAFARDFWGLPPERSIGSYRPLPNLIWRLLWLVGAREGSVFAHHWVNIQLHALNAALLTRIVFAHSRRVRFAWLAGSVLVVSAVLTEAVTGVVGLADVLAGTAALKALEAARKPLRIAIPTAFVWMLVGLSAKESALAIGPAVALVALAFDRSEGGRRILAIGRAVALAGTAIGALVLYVELRRRFFPVAVPPELSDEALASKGELGQLFGRLLRWFAQPVLPRDPINNPLVTVGNAWRPRLAGASRVFGAGLRQLVLPWTLSGDYSANAEPVPQSWREPGVAFGGIAFVVAAAASLAGLVVSAAKPRKGWTVVTGFCGWVLICYFPVSNVPVLLPTIRAERFWYLPAIGTSFLFALCIDRAGDMVSRFGRRLALFVAAFFLGFHAISARLHADDYSDDLTFWERTAQAVPNSAKAHLNYSVMLGSRRRLPERLAENRRALAIAPDWAMAHVYLGDTLCRMGRAWEGIPAYEHGFTLAPNDAHLVALGLQCLWEHHVFEDETVPDRFETLASGASPAASPQVLEESPPPASTAPLATSRASAASTAPLATSRASPVDYRGTWLGFLVRDLLDNGAAHGGVDPKYRPRSYNDGPKRD